LLTALITCRAIMFNRVSAADVNPVRFIRWFK